MTFVVKGRSETYDPRGGYPLPFKDALITGEAPYTGKDAIVPRAGSEILSVTEAARNMVDNPDTMGLTPLQLSRIVNWDLGAREWPAFTVFEKSVVELQEAMEKGVTTSEDITREYLARIATYDKRGPAFRSMLSLNPRAIADARERDLDRGAFGRTISPFHGVPIVFKDNIDVTELPTTGGSLALLDHRPRLDSKVAAGMKAGRAVVLGKANLDEFPFGDFGISTVGGTVGNAYDPSLSTSGSSGGSATAVAASLAALGFGTDTCNSLSNPARLCVTRHDSHDARSDEPRRRDAAQHLQRRRGPDGQVDTRCGARARPRNRFGRRGSGHRRGGGTHLRIVCGRSRHRHVERQTHRRATSTLRRFHGRT